MRKRMTKHLIGTAEVPAITQHPRPTTYPWTKIHEAHRDTYFQIEVKDAEANKRQSTIALSGKYFCEHNAPSLKVVSRRIRTGNKLLLRFWLKPKAWGHREVPQGDTMVREQHVVAGVA